MFRMVGQTAGPIETKLDTRTHVHPGSVSVKVNVKVIHAEQRAPKARVELRPEDG